MSKLAFYNGILYQIEYQPQLSNSDYTQHKVYHIKTEAIASIMEDKLLLLILMAEKWEKSFTNIKEKSDGFIYIRNNRITIKHALSLYHTWGII